MAKRTFGDMFSKVVRQVGLTNTFDDGLEETESIKEDINDIQKQVLSMSKTFLKKAGILISGGTVADQANYAIPATVDKITNLQITVSTVLYYPTLISITEFHRLANTGASSDIPIFYTIDKSEIYLYPTPATNSNPIEVNAGQIATDLVTDPAVTTDQTTDLQIKEGYENTIYYYALSEAFNRLEDFASGDRYNIKYEKMFKNYKSEVRNPTDSIVVKAGSTGFINPNYYSTLTN